jgi:hypothetical protein
MGLIERQWNWARDANGGGVRFAQALGLTSNEEFVRSVLGLAGAVEHGHDAWIIALRTKFDAASGNELDDYSQPGDWETIGYRFSFGEGEEQQTWEVDRDRTFEGESAATDLAHALAFHTDREFCESMAQIKALLDRIGGQAFIRPFIQNEEVVGIACHYEHLVRKPKEEKKEAGPQEPLPEPAADSSPAEPEGLDRPQEQDEADADSPAESQEELPVEA